MEIGDRCEVKIGDKWYPGTVLGTGLGPLADLTSVAFDIQGAACNVTADKLRASSQLSFSRAETPVQRKNHNAEGK
jgi:hypothetical protein